MSWLRCSPVPFLALATLLCGCSTPPPISLALTSSANAIDQSLSVALQAAVTNDTSLKGVAWTLNGVGSLSTATGPSTTYLPPSTAALTAPQKVTVTATSIAPDHRKPEPLHSLPDGRYRNRRPALQSANRPQLRHRALPVVYLQRSHPLWDLRRRFAPRRPHAERRHRRPQRNPHRRRHLVL
jgi:hypothetical protein